ncbi:MAG: DUF4270 family protein [Sphingobacteriales bacterium]
MKFFRLDLLTLLISLFILNSCKNQDKFGLGGNSNAQAGTGLVDTSTIVINTVPDDSVATVGLAKNPFGIFNDPIFGGDTSSLATDINLPGTAAYTPPSGTISIDSARLVLHYADGFYGDSIASSYTVNVYTLKEQYISGTTYYNTKKWKYDNNNLIGSLTFNARTHDSVTITNIVTGGPDVPVKVPPQIRIPISTNFINRTLFGASATTLGSNTIFQGINNGLYITLDPNKTKGAGGIFMIKPTDSIVVYYRAVNGATIDTAQVALPITQMAAQIPHDKLKYSQAIQTELANTTTGSRNTFYLQGLGGLRAKVSFPKLLVNLRGNLLKKDSDIVIDRAELVVTPSPGTNSPFWAIPKISMYQLDIAHQRVLLQDAGGDIRTGGAGVFGGYYALDPNTGLHQYHFIITAYLQDLLLGRTVDYGTYLAPIDNTNTSSVDIAVTPQIASRTVAVGTDKNSPFRIKLNIIYTKIGRIVK